MASVPTDVVRANEAPGPDPIRIVPVHRVDELAQPAHGAAPAAAPHLVYNGGPLLTAVEVFTLFWGSWWRGRDGRRLAGELNGFFDDILTSELVDQLAEYSVEGSSIGHGTRTGTTTIASPAPDRAMPDAKIRTALQRLLAAGTLPPANPNTLYFVYLPPNVTVVQGGDRSCQAFCGYHNDIDGGVFYAVMPFPGCSGCAGGLSPLDALTSTSSHELCEAITDPVPGAGWYDSTHGEIGDVCAWKTRRLGAHMIQLEWSNAHGRCS